MFGPSPEESLLNHSIPPSSTFSPIPFVEFSKRMRGPVVAFDKCKDTCGSISPIPTLPSCVIRKCSVLAPEDLSENVISALILPEP